MPIPTLFSDLADTAAGNSNYPAGTENPKEGDNHLRQVYAFLRQLSDDKAALADLAGTGAGQGATLVGVEGGGAVQDVVGVEVAGAVAALPEAPPVAFGALIADEVDIEAKLATNGSCTKLRAGRTYRIGPDGITIPDSKTLDLNGATLLANYNGGGANTSIMVRLGNKSRLVGGTIDCGNTQGASTVNTDGATFGAYVGDKSGAVIERCEFTNYQYAAIVTNTGSGTRARGNIVRKNKFTAYSWSSTKPDNLQQAIYVGSTEAANNTVIGTFATNWEQATHTHGTKVYDNEIYGGQYGIALQRCSDTSVWGNTVREASRGISIQMQTRDVSVIGNTLQDNHTTGIHMASGIRGFTVVGNTVTGTSANDNVGIQAYYGCQDGVIAHNTLDSRFDLYTGGESGADLRAPASGIRIGQMCKGIRIEGNKIKGYLVGIQAWTTIYPGSITGADPNFQKSGLRDIDIVGNQIEFDYEQATATAVKGQFLQSNSYGVWVSKSLAGEDSTAGAWGLDGVRVSDNRMRNTNFPVVWEYIADTSGNPVAKSGLDSFENRSASTIGTNDERYTGTMTSADVDSRGNTWKDSIKDRATSFTPTTTNLTIVGSVTVAGKRWRIGERVRFEITITSSGGGTSASSLGATAISVGITSAGLSTASVVNGTTGASLGTAVVNTSGNVVPPTWAATTNTIVITGEYRAAA